MITRREVEEIDSAAGLTEMAHKLGYENLREFLTDNPGAIEAIVVWVLENHNFAEDDDEEE